MEPGFSWTISGATILVILGWVASIVAMTWKRSGEESDQKSLLRSTKKRLDELYQKVETTEQELVEQIESTASTFDARASALQAATALTRDQHHELREHLARNYMPREEIAAMERRHADSTNHIRAQIDKLEGRLDSMQEKILQAIAAARLS